MSNEKEIEIKVNDKHEHIIVIEKDHISINGKVLDWDKQVIKPGEYHILWEGKSYNAEVVSANLKTKEFSIRVNGNLYELKASDHYDRLLEDLGMGLGSMQQIKEIKAPMPGLVLEINIKAGDTLAKGDAVLILEAMKMENVLKSPGEGVVKTVNVKKGDAVEKNQALIILE